MLTCLVASAAMAAAPSVDELGWLAGHWRAEGDGGVITEEHWSAPLGGTLLGAARTVHQGVTVSFEHLQIAATPDGLAYIAWPGGDGRTAFALAELGPDHVVFVNPDHDFPQRIRYARAADGALEVVAEAGDRRLAWTLRALAPEAAHAAEPAPVPSGAAAVGANPPDLEEVN